MPKVSVSVGFTLKLRSGEGYEFFRPEMRIDEIDTEGDVEAQLSSAEKALETVWGKAVSLACQQASAALETELFAPEVGKELYQKMVTLARKIKNIENQLEK